ncbi:MAG: helix-turn-helix domain-containing protein [Hominimerdicola sp.]
MAKYPECDSLTTVSEKLKWHRLNCGLLQKELAYHMEVDRTTYIRYEDNVLDAYPLDKLSKAAEFLHIPLTALLDEYNLFLYNGQARQIKMLRKSLKLTQRELAERMSVDLGTVKKWERDKARISKRKYLKLTKLDQN